MTFSLVFSSAGSSHDTTDSLRHSTHAPECRKLSVASWLLPAEENTKLHKQTRSSSCPVHCWEKVAERAGGRQAYRVRSRDGRAQPRAAWAMAQAEGRGRASDGADITRRARGLVPLSSCFVPSQNGSRLTELLTQATSKKCRGKTR